MCRENKGGWWGESRAGENAVMLCASCFSKTCETLIQPWWNPCSPAWKWSGSVEWGFFIPARWETWHNLPVVTEQILRKSGPKRVDLGFIWGFLGLSETLFSGDGEYLCVRNCTVSGSFWAAHASIPSADPGQYQVWLCFSTAALAAWIYSGARTSTVLGSGLGDCWTHQGALSFSCWPEERGQHSALTSQEAKRHLLGSWDPGV